MVEECKRRLSLCDDKNELHKNCFEDSYGYFCSWCSCKRCSKEKAEKLKYDQMEENLNCEFCRTYSKGHRYCGYSCDVCSCKNCLDERQYEKEEDERREKIRQSKRYIITRPSSITRRGATFILPTFLTPQQPVYLHNQHHNFLIYNKNYE